MYILVVDDDADYQEVLSCHLRRLGFEVECATDAGEARVLFHRRRQRGDPYALLLIDLEMPGMSGIYLHHLIENWLGQTQVRFISGAPTREEREYASSRGIPIHLKGDLHENELDRLFRPLHSEDVAMCSL